MKADNNMWPTIGIKGGIPEYLRVATGDRHCTCDVYPRYYREVAVTSIVSSTNARNILHGMKTITSGCPSENPERGSW